MNYNISERKVISNIKYNITSVLMLDNDLNSYSLYTIDCIEMMKEHNRKESVNDSVTAKIRRLCVEASLLVFSISRSFLNANESVIRLKMKNILFSCVLLLLVYNIITSETCDREEEESVKSDEAEIFISTEAGKLFFRVSNHHPAGDTT